MNIALKIIASIIRKGESKQERERKHSEINGMKRTKTVFIYR
jgi:hypothetical protein